ncbi:MAG TPA: DUF4290 domain-containing protein [Bacteroidia bacterium]|nr:DUF4290 domain-containing protein [Bacteroidia bacterium]HNT79792.1 DUF4290 domain-containing protein [Bacteroidia bacterium]
MEYNTSRTKLVIPEYGRNIQKLIDHCVAIEDRAERTKMALAIVKVMGQLNPQLRESTDNNEKLWDHMYIISNFKLDVDVPYSFPAKEHFLRKPKRIAYPSNRIKYKHYGRNVERFIEGLIKMEDGENKEKSTVEMANFMKSLYKTWNKDNAADEVIIENLKDMSKGELSVPDNTRLAFIPDTNRNRQNSGSKGRRNRKGKSRSHGHKRKNR